MDLAEAIRLMDRKRLPEDLRKVVSGAATRQSAIQRLESELGDAPASSPQGDDGEGDEPPTDEDEAPAPNPDVEDEYDEWTNDELRDELEERELSTSGKKADLIARLREDDGS